MSLRRESNLHLSREVLEALWILSRAESDIGKNITVDELADRMLRHSIESFHPEIFAYQEDEEKRKKAFIESLKK